MKDINPYESPKHEIKDRDRLAINNFNPKKVFVWTFLIYESTNLLLLLIRYLIFGMVRQDSPSVLDIILMVLWVPGIPILLVFAPFLPMPFLVDEEIRFTDLLFEFFISLCASLMVATIFALISYFGSHTKTPRRLKANLELLKKKE